LLAEFRSLDLETLHTEALCEHDIHEVQLQALRAQAATVGDPQERARIEVTLAQTLGERRRAARQAGVNEKIARHLQLQVPWAGCGGLREPRRSAKPGRATCRRRFAASATRAGCGSSCPLAPPSIACSKRIWRRRGHARPTSRQPFVSEDGSATPGPARWLSC